MTSRFSIPVRINFKKTFPYLNRGFRAALWSLLAYTASSYADISGKIELSSERTLRGIAQTENNFAPSISAKYESKVGVYFGTLISRNDFRNPTDSSEQRYFLGYSPEIAGSIGLDATYIYYDFRQSAENGNTDWSEAHLRLSFNQETALLFSAADNWIGQGITYQMEVNHLHSLTSRLSIQALAGIALIPEDSIEDYTYAGLGIIYGATPRVYLRADINAADNAAETLFGDRSDSTARLSIGYLFNN